MVRKRCLRKRHLARQSEYSRTFERNNYILYLQADLPDCDDVKRNRGPGRLSCTLRIPVFEYRYSTRSRVWQHMFPKGILLALESAWLGAFQLEFPTIFCQRHSNHRRKHVGHLPSRNVSLNSRLFDAVSQQWLIGTTRIVQYLFAVHYQCNTTRQSW